MNDLISRSELLKIFTFNSDGKRIPEYDVDNVPLTVSISSVKLIIRGMPNAFNTEKVIAELEREKDSFHGGIYEGTAEEFYFQKGIDKAIDIINKYLSGTAEPSKTD